MAPSLSKADEAVIREIAHQVVSERQARHIEACPWGQKIGQQKAWYRGLVFGVAVPTLIVATAAVAGMVQKWAGGP